MTWLSEKPCIYEYMYICIYLFFTDIRSDLTQNKLNVNAPEFTVNREIQTTNSISFFPMSATFLQHSKSSGNIHHKLQLAVARHQAEQMTKSPTILVQNLPMVNEGQINVSGVLLFFIQF